MGRYKYNKKLGVANRIRGRRAAEKYFTSGNRRAFVEIGQRIDREMALAIENAGIKEVYVLDDEENVVKVVGNHFVDIRQHIPFNIENLNIPQKVHYPVLKEILDTYKDEHDICEALKERRKELSPKHIIVDDIVASISYILNLAHGIGDVDDIDHLGNRRLRSVGELLQNQFRIGLSRMERVVKERMTIQDVDVITPQALINIRPMAAAIKNFWKQPAVSIYGSNKSTG